MSTTSTQKTAASFAAVAVGVAVTALSSVGGCASHDPTRPGDEQVSPVEDPVGPVPGVGEPGPSANPLGSDRRLAVEGRRWFVRYNCSGCHGGRAGGGMGPSLRDVVWLYGEHPAQIANSIARGRAHGMPAWGGRLPDKHIWELVAYIQSLRTPDEPDPP